MGRLTKQERLKANGLATLAPEIPESAHHQRCGSCGQIYDLRNLGDVLHHDQTDHDSIPPSEMEPRLRFIPPVLPTLTDEPPAGDAWLHEIKHDGYRTQLHVEPAGVRLYTRNAYDWTARYAPLAAAAGQLRCTSAIIDGEVIVQDAEGRSDFHNLKAAIHSRPADLVFMAFDIMHLDGRDLRPLPLTERRCELEALLGPNNPKCPIHFSEGIIGNGMDLFAAADAMQLEGIVSKKLTSRYTSGRSRDWLKSKTFAEDEFVVIGVKREPGRPSVALLARESDGRLEYVGGAAVTLQEAEKDRFWRTMEVLAAKQPIIPMSGTGEWVEPRLRVRSRFLRNEPKLRHATLTGLVALGR